MRTARIKVKAEAGEAVYHCMTKTVNGERLFNDTGKEILRRQLWLVAEFCGVQILTYAILSNHFHVLARATEGERGRHRTAPPRTHRPPPAARDRRLGR